MRDTLIPIFRRWGLPAAMKVDNGAPFGDPFRKSIPVLGLWLIALDVEVIWNRPAQPTDNAKVERMQGTSGRWAEVDRCSNLKQLADRLTDVITIQREQYEVSRLGYKTRIERYPELENVTAVDACSCFKAQRAYDFLAKTRLVRRVSSNGRVSLYGHGYQVGTAHKKEEVGVGFDPSECAWIFYDAQDQAIRKVPAKALSPEHIWSLSVSQRTS